MDIQCTYDEKSVHIMAIEPSQKSGYVNIIYVDSSNRLKLDTIEYASIIATGCTII